MYNVIGSIFRFSLGLTVMTSTKMYGIMKSNLLFFSGHLPRLIKFMSTIEVRKKNKIQDTWEPI